MQQVSGGADLALAGKVVLLINGLRPDGRRLVDLLARQGADVAVITRRPQPPLAAEIRAAVHAYGRRCLILRGAVPAKMIQTIVAQLGRLDAVVAYPVGEIENDFYDGPLFRERPLLTAAGDHMIRAEREK